MREMGHFDSDDARWLFGWSRFRRREPAPPQGRFNAGQKLNSALVGALMVVMFVTGVLFWLGERDIRYRFAGTVIVHDWATCLLVARVVAHLLPGARPPLHALRRMVVGDVDREWARRHHEKWLEVSERELPGAPASESSSRGDASLRMSSLTPPASEPDETCFSYVR